MGQFAVRFPDGIEGKASVLSFLSRIAVDSVRTDPTIRETAAAALHSTPTPPTTTAQRAAALLQFVADVILYTPDPNSTEWIQSPGRTLEVGIGDCDDVTALMLALCRSVGVRARPVGVGAAGNLFHVAPQVLIGGRWLWADPCLPRPALGARMPLPDTLIGPEV